MCLELCDARLFLATSLNPKLTKVTIHVGVHTHVMDDSKVKIFDKGIEAKVKIVASKKPHASPSVIVMHVNENTIMEKILVGNGGPCLQEIT
jgi:hypothetical protein